jgi:alpha-tubulin suppressor-like RCC1 family protein
VAIGLGVAHAFPASADAVGAHVEAWGDNYYGQLGNGTTQTTGCACIDSPVPVTGITDAVQVSGGDYHALALRPDGTVRSWGYNHYGELGNGTTSDSSTPVSVHGITNAVAVAGSSEHSVALLANGSVVAWGDNNTGELGLGTTSGPDTCNGHACSKTPVPVPGLTGVVAIAASYYYSLVLRKDGTVYAWGNNQNGEVGDGKGTKNACSCIARPTAVPGLSVPGHSGVMAISAGWYLASALLKDGSVKDWGYTKAARSATARRRRPAATASVPSRLAASHTHGRSRAAATTA